MPGVCIDLFCVLNRSKTTFYFIFRKVGSDAAKRRAAWDRTAGGVLLTGFFFYIVTSTLVSPPQHTQYVGKYAQGAKVRLLSGSE